MPNGHNSRKQYILKQIVNSISMILVWMKLLPRLLVSKEESVIFKCEMKVKKSPNPKRMFTYHYQIKEMMLVTRFKRNLMVFFLGTTILLSAILITLIPIIIYQKNHLSRCQMKFPTDLKYILFWTQSRKDPFRRNDFKEFKDGQRTFIDQKCPHINCYISYNKSFFSNDGSNFDAIVFDVHDVSKFKNIDFNFTKRKDQKYIFRSHNSAESHPVCNSMFDDFFTLTWTYKLDSDIPHPFLSIFDDNKKLVGPRKFMKWVKTMNHSDSTKRITKKKHKGVAWVVRRCRLKKKHQEFVKEIRRELRGYNHNVDVYGPCGDKKCPNKSLTSCFKMVEKDYFFQMVLEDSFTEDYVDENIVKSLNYFSVPIVLGGADYTRFLPPGSYINANAFNIKKLGALIDYLIKNPLIYEYFFDWKNHYTYTVKHNSQVCELCEKLNSKNIDLQTTKSNFRKWWNPNFKDLCERLHLLDLFNS